MSNFNIKTNRTFSFIRKYAWVFTVLVAIGGLWVNKLGLLVIPIIISLTTMAFFKGRFWCGNFCPHGSLYDSVMMRIGSNRKIPAFFKSKILGVVFFGWFGYNLTRKIIKVSAIFGTMKFWDKLGFIFVASYLMVLIVGGILSLFVAPRTWCQFCPMGTIQILAYKLGKLLGVTKKTDEKITVSSVDICHSCGKCSRVCPMQLTPYLEFTDKNQFDHEKCIRCSTCVVNCPAEVLTLENEADAQKTVMATDTKGYEDRREMPATITDIKELKKAVAEFTFKLEDVKQINYKAGQFILVRIQDDPLMNRAYSISSFNRDTNTLSVTVKRIEDGYGSDIMFNMKVGDKVKLEGPMGKELIVDKNANKVLLVAGGIGITPFGPIVKDLMEKSNNIETVKLVYGVNYEDEFIYDEEFKKLELQYSRFEYIKVVAFDKNWKGKRGFVTNVIEEMDLNGYKVYMCGPKPMVNASLKVFDDLGFDKENVYVESA